MSYSSFAAVYDELTENVGYEKRAEYFCSLLSDYGLNGGLLLDLACGTGTLSLEFAKKGFSVIGVDISEEMLAEAQNKKYEQGDTDTIFLCQDMRELDLFGTVDCCVCALDSLNHLTDKDDLLKAFRSVSLFMNDGGIFVFDMNTPYKHKSVLAEKCFVYDLDGVYCVWQNSPVGEDLTVDITLDFFTENEDGTYERSGESFAERAYEYEAVKSLLEKADFELLENYGDMTRETPSDDAERTVFIARRKTRNG